MRSQENQMPVFEIVVTTAAAYSEKWEVVAADPDEAFSKFNAGRAVCSDRRFVSQPNTPAKGISPMEIRTSTNTTLGGNSLANNDIHQIPNGVFVTDPGIKNIQIATSTVKNTV